MLVEFLGTTAAGKTALIGGVEHRLAGRRPVMTALDLVTRLTRLPRVPNATLQNMVQEVVALGPFLWSAPGNRRCLVTATRLLLRARPGIDTITRVRALQRSLGVRAICTRHSPDMIILFDEGPLVVGHVLLQAAQRLTPDDVTELVSAFPLPDVAVYVRAPVEAVIRRTLARFDPPRPLRGRDREHVRMHAEAAASLFDQIVRAVASRRQVLVVDNPDAPEQKRDELTASIARFVLSQTLLPPGAQDRPAGSSD